MVAYRYHCPVGSIKSLFKTNILGSRSEQTFVKRLGLNLEGARYTFEWGAPLRLWIQNFRWTWELADGWYAALNEVVNLRKINFVLDLVVSRPRWLQAALTAIVMVKCHRETDHSFHPKEKRCVRLFKGVEVQRWWFQ